MPTVDVLCFSHLRWDSVFERPHHLMTRLARDARVFFVEAPVFDTETPQMTVADHGRVHVVVPHLVPGSSPSEQTLVQRRLLATILDGYRVDHPLAWLTTPAALPLLEDVDPCGVVYDCDGLVAGAGSSAAFGDRERDLLARADVVFTSGHALYQAKRAWHRNIHPVPSGVDVAHFESGRVDPAPADQKRIARPRIGYCGVIDGRLDRALVDAVAGRRPDWHIVMIGPVTVDPASLPRRSNVHYLGVKPYETLPAYFAGWDAAILPFAADGATRDLNPAQTLDYLAAGCPVVSTSIRDVAHFYGEQGIVQIADTADDFIAAIGRALAPGGRAAVGRAKSLLARMSWEFTFKTMRDQIDAIIRVPEPVREPRVVASTALVLHSYFAGATSANG